MVDAAVPPPVPAAVRADLDPAVQVRIKSNGTVHLNKYLRADHKDANIKVEDLAGELLPAFEGNESEQNWTHRETNILVLRKLTCGNAPKNYSAVYISILRSLLDGIIKAVSSLRTSLSTNGCLLIQEATQQVGAGMDPVVDILLHTLYSLCRSTKSIASKNGDTTITTLFNNVTYSPRLMQCIWNGASDKNLRPRTYATGWLKTLIARFSHQKQILEHSNGLVLIEKVVNKGLADADPGVRDKARDAYWHFNAVWPARGEIIMSGLKTQAQSQLLSHPSNPDPTAVPKAAEPTISKAKTLSRTANTTSRPSLRETMMASRKAAAEAQRSNHKRSTSDPDKPALTNPEAPLASQPKPSAFKAPRPATAMGHGSLSSAPKRPVKPKKPDIIHSASQPAFTTSQTSQASQASQASQPSQPSQPSNNGVSQTPASSRRPGLSVARSTKEANKPRVPSNFHSFRPNTREGPQNGSVSSMSERPKKHHTSHSSVTLPSRGRTNIEKPSTPKPFRESPTKAAEDFTMIMPSAQPRSQANLNESSLLDFDGAPAVVDTPTGTSVETPQESPATGGQATHEESGIETTQNANTISTDEIGTLDDESTITIARSPVKETVPLNTATPERKPLAFRKTTPAARSTADKVSEVDKNPSPIQVGQSNDVEAPPAGAVADASTTTVNIEKLDAHGYRKLQKLVRTTMSSSRLLTLAPAIIERLRCDPQNDDRLVMQQALTLETMFKERLNLFLGFVPSAVHALLSAMGRQNKISHLTTMLQKNLQTFLCVDDTGVQEATVKEIANTMNKQSWMVQGIACDALANMVRSSNGEMSTTSRQDVIDTLLAITSAGISAGDAAVRRSAIGLGLEVFKVVNNASKFWRSLPELKEDERALFMYYIGKENAV